MNTTLRHIDRTQHAVQITLGTGTPIEPGLVSSAADRCDGYAAIGCVRIVGAATLFGHADDLRRLAAAVLEVAELCDRADA